MKSSHVPWARSRVPAGRACDLRKRLGLTEGGAVFLTALLAGQSLGHAAAAALEEVPDFDLGAGISGVLAAGAFIAAEFGEES